MTSQSKDGENGDDLELFVVRHSSGEIAAGGFRSKFSAKIARNELNGPYKKEGSNEILPYRISKGKNHRLTLQRGLQH